MLYELRFVRDLFEVDVLQAALKQMARVKHIQMTFTNE